MHLDPHTTLSWAYQLHYYLCFRTRSRNALMSPKLIDTLNEICDRHNYNVLRLKTYLRTIPRMSIEECALSLLNNGQYFVSKHEPKAIVRAGIDGLWQPSAYAGTTGKVTTALLKEFLS